MSAFISFCQTAELIGAIASRLEKAQIIGDYFAPLSDDDLRRAALYFGPTIARALCSGTRYLRATRCTSASVTALILAA